MRDQSQPHVEGMKCSGNMSGAFVLNKASFFLGFFAGIAVSAVVALIIIVSMLLSGKSLAAPAAVANNPTPSGVVAGTDPTQPTTPSAPLKQVDEKADHIRGAKNAKVTLVEYSDFECPFCKRHHDTLQQLLKDYPNDVRLVYRHFPLSFHPNAMPAARASECAAELGGNDAFWAFHDKVFAANPNLGDAMYKQAAKELKLDEKKFADCLASNKYDAKINQQEAEGGASGVGGTPGTFVNGQLVEGAVPVEQLKAIIDQIIKS